MRCVTSSAVAICELLLEKAARHSSRAAMRGVWPARRVDRAAAAFVPRVQELKGHVLIFAEAADHAGCAVGIQARDDGDRPLVVSDAGSTTSTRTMVNASR